MEAQQKMNEKGGMFFLEENGIQIAKMTYIWNSSTIFEIDHTIVDSNQEGKGLGKILVLAAVDYARKNDFKINPTCSYAKRVLTKTDEFKDVLN